jgi:hypothetical protein
MSGGFGDKLALALCQELAELRWVGPQPPPQAAPSASPNPGPLDLATPFAFLLATGL